MYVKGLFEVYKILQRIGIKPKDFDKVVGKKIKKNVQADQPIRKSLIY